MRQTGNPGSARLRRPGILLAAAIAAAGCSSFGGPIQGEQALSPEERRLRDIEAGIALNTQRLDNLAEMQSSRQTVTEELRELRGEIERLRFEFEQSKDRDRRLYQDLDRRLTVLEGGTPAPMRRSDSVDGGDVVLLDPSLAGDAAEGQARTPRRRATPDPKEDAAYTEAFELLKQGKYADAILGFENVIRNWPDGRHADNALYWAGESHYVQGEFGKALEKFNKLLNEHPASSRVPDALLKAGFAYEETGQKDKAKASLQRILSEYPQSSVASLAQQRLSRLR